MPIANCIVTPECRPGSGNLVELWAQESGKSAEHMTVNVISSSQQFGNSCAVMANLQLPSLWGAPDISALQLGLATALAKYFCLPPDQVHVITTTVGSGRVVENGREITW